jgi:DNA-binding GntR family transcriptional regulator
MATILPLRPQTPTPRAVKSTKPAAVAESIREMIIEDVLPPGAPIRERALAEQLAVSRTPLREALKMLAAEGLVEIAPRRGAVVAAPSSREIRELLQLLGVIEALAGELACLTATATDIKEMRALHYEMLAAYTRGDRLGYFRRNQDIHRALVACTHNDTLIAYHAIINARVYRARYICNLRTQRWESAIREHAAILDALEAKDRTAIGELLKTHVIKAWDLMESIEADERAAHVPGSAAITAFEPRSEAISSSE